MRLVIARCSVDYIGRLRAHLPLATRLLLVKADGSVLVHSDGGSYKPLNWMSPPATLRIIEPAPEDAELGVMQTWNVQHAKSDDRLVISIHELMHESSHDLGVDPGLVKDGVEADLQRLLAEQITLLGDGYSLIRREYMTAIGPVDILARDGHGRTVAIELKRRGDIDGVEQLTRYLELLNRDPLMAPVKGVYAAQQIKPQARVLAQDRGIDCLTLDYDAMRGVDDVDSRCAGSTTSIRASSDVTPGRGTVVPVQRHIESADDRNRWGGGVCPGTTGAGQDHCRRRRPRLRERPDYVRRSCWGIPACV
ncbi:hypothetical protein BJ994_001883 [Arthrobacter pigmenti]|uniref:Endonuclease NucS n=1 Tax=Arthrobacter pigmenti TaxID=271432 RepID=A0A846RRM7_9MICC|nr:hypothetical protein [Arthrobacter pigmenti]